MRAEGGARLRLEQRIVGPGLPGSCIDRLGNDVEVAGEHERVSSSQQFARAVLAQRSIQASL